MKEIEVMMNELAEEFSKKDTNIKSAQIDKDGIIVIIQDMRQK